MTEQTSLHYEFGAFRLIPSERRLVRDDQSIALPPKAFQALLLLVENHGRAVTKEELISKLWPDSFVEESNLNHYISLVRKALADGTNGNRLIETLPKLGYRFTAEVRESNAQTQPVLVHRHTRTHVVFTEEQSENLKTVRTLQTAVGRQGSLLKRIVISSTAVLIIGGVAGTYFGYIRPAQMRAARVPVVLSLSNSSSNNHLSENSSARDAYSQGRYFWSKRTTNDIRLSEQYFQQAIALDRNFALAYVGLADDYLIDDPMKAEPTLRKALEIDNTLGEAHASLGFLRMFYHWDWAGAQKEFEQAVALSPNYATAHQWYAIYLATQGQLNESQQEMTKAVELDAKSPNLHADLGQVLYFAHKYREAIAECRKALELDPNFILAHEYLYDVYAEEDMYAEAVEEIVISERASSRITDAATTSKRTVFRKAGWKGFLQSEVTLRRSQDSHVGGARLYAMLGEKERAIGELENSFDAKDFFLTFIKVEPVFDSLRSDARFQTLLRRMNLN